MFGYGSLICTESRNRSMEKAKAIPVKVKDLQRCWNFRNFERQRNVLGVIKKEGASCNGVIFPVNNFTELNEREKGYKLVELDSSQIEVMEGELKTGKFWVYIPEESIFPTADYPIQQSYIDVVMTGCLEFGEEFALEMVKNTEWSEHWVNDRDKPNYSRYLENVDVEKIDSVLKEVK